MASFPGSRRPSRRIRIAAYLTLASLAGLFAAHRLLDHADARATVGDTETVLATEPEPFTAEDGDAGTPEPAMAPADAGPLSGDPPPPLAEMRVTETPRWSDYRVQPGDTLSALFERAGFGAGVLVRVLDDGLAKRTMATLHPGDQVSFHTTPSGDFAGLRYEPGPERTLVVTAGANGVDAHIEQAPVHYAVRVAAGQVNGSLSGAMAGAGVPAGVAAVFTKIFHWKVDFRRDLRRGARFSVAYVERSARGRRIGTGPVLAARLTNRGHTLEAYRYEDDAGDIHYYDDDGESLSPSLLRTPVNYTRVSSPFTERRWHPTLHIYRPHHGVDLAAPIGTPIRAAGDGTVTFAGHSHGYGRLVKIRHFGPYATRYGHLHRFAKGMHSGTHVHQGQVIGYVGESGEATGPHLHFEIRVNGTPHDPLKVALPDGTSVPDGQLAAYHRAITPFSLALAHPDERPALARLASAFETVRDRRRVADTETQTRGSGDGGKMAPPVHLALRSSDGLTGAAD